MSKVSVIIPVYNVEKFLRRCLDSVINQTLTDLEIICVNDGSTDGSADILEEYSKKDNRIKIIYKSNGGLSSARNVGIDIATGEYIGFVDSDDFIEPDFYEKLYNSATENNCDISCAGIIRENEKKHSVLIDYREKNIYTEVVDIFKNAYAPKYCFVWNKIYKTTLLKDNEIKFINGLLFEDMPFTADVLGITKSLVTVPDTKYHYWKNPDSIIKTETDKSRADKLFAKEYILDKCLELGISLSEKDTLTAKNKYYLFGIPVLKCYQYRATRKYYLFGFIPFLTIEENV